ncbi:hypothetical protein [Planktothrix mougeotii]|uniref:Uncharacterized protein n=1 Tax=Planktothrix mougeotii LEGE 06226 TaxID=1828728 RepID=A0ABR9U873_9CYAN|nr:hypothetical protein [Planktothrix mougeotii]MBE9142653.1 hypothetical protein [Planktothrix mougeotii LEGE 06226]
MRVHPRFIALLSVLCLLPAEPLYGFPLQANNNSVPVAQFVNPSNSLAPEFPISLAGLVKQKAMELTGVPASSVTLLNAERRIWPNGCLGLSFPDIACSQSQVEGWLVTVKSGEKGLLFRTDNRGNTIYLENGLSVLPVSVQEAVLKTAQSQSGIPRNQLQIIQANSRLWDGCLGIYQPHQMCPQIAIMGWQITVRGRGQRWIYHTNQDGFQVRLYSTTTQGNNNIGTLQPIPFSPSEVSPSLPRGAVFQTISSGGITGGLSKVTLWSDGWITSQQLNGGQPSVIQRNWIPPQEVQAFQRLLTTQQLTQYHRLSFPAPSGAADFITVTLVGQATVTRYADLNVQFLPQPLRTIITAWEQIQN